MGEVISFQLRAKPVPTWDELVAACTQSLLDDWEKMAQGNRLNDYFKAVLPNLTSREVVSNYMADLNGAATIERKLDMWPVIYFPGTCDNNGWVIVTNLGSFSFKTPEFANEAYARCFNILLFIRVKQAAISAGFIDE